MFPHRFKHWNSWSPVGGTIWLGLGVVPLHEKVCHEGQTLRFQRLSSFSGLLSLFHAWGSSCEPLAS